MRIAMLARNPNLYSHRRLVHVAEAKGHQIDIINTTQCYANITSDSPQLLYRGATLTGYDAVIPRIGASITFYGLAVLRQFEMMGVWTLNQSEAIGRARDKLWALQIMSRLGIGLPATSFANSARRSEDLIRMVGGPPVVIKLVEGTQGLGVVLGETMPSAKSTFEAFRGAKINILVQEFVKEAGGADIRAFVVGDQVVGAMKRQSGPGEFRSNLHRGGTAEKINITPEENSAAIRACRALGLNVAGVDMLRSSRGPVLIEVNSTPGLEGIERSTGNDIAGRIIAFIETNARPMPTKTQF